MRSIFIHLKECKKSDLESIITDVDSESIFIDFYENHLAEYDSSDAQMLKTKLGIFPPAVSLSINICGVITGYRETLAIAEVILSNFKGVVDDDDSDGIWTLNELLDDEPSNGHYFMERIRRHKGLPIGK